MYREKYEYTWTGDSEVKFNGKGCIQFADGGEIGGNWRDGNRHGRCSTTSPAAGIVQLAGDYKNNKLRGIGKVFMEDERTIISECR